jgi:cyclohexyl-isocyanide hydratase
MKTLRIGMPIYHHVDLIDVSAPWDVLSRINAYWKEGRVELLLVAASDALVTTGQSKLQLQPQTTFKKCPHLDVLLVPGIEDPSEIVKDKDYRDFLREKAHHARIVASVCTGAILLANAGLLDGYRATTHALAIGTLQGYKKVIVANGTRATSNAATASLPAASPPASTARCAWSP